MRLSLLLVLALALMCLPLLAFAGVGTFSRYAADDYCTASQVVMAGFANAQSRLYVAWSGRFAATLMITAFEVLGIRAVPVLAFVALSAWVASLIWAVREVACAVGTRLSVVAAALVAVTLVYATLEITADMPQDVYWQTGLLTYLSPLVLSSLLIALVARGPVSRPRIGACLVLALLAGGTSETFAAAQVAALILACVALVVFGSRWRLSMLVVSLAGAVAALAILALAPGNEARQAVAERTPLLVALPEALDFTRGWLRLTFARPHAITLALVLLIPAALAYAHRARAISIRLAAYLVVAFGLVLLACMLPAFYALNSNPPGRAQLIPEYLVVCGVALIGWCLGSFVRPMMPVLPRWLAAPAAACLLALLAVGPLLTAVHALQNAGAARTYAANWDALDAQIRASRNEGQTAVTVPPLPSTGNVENLDFVGPDQNDWFNQCVAAYYGVASIATTP